VQLGQATGYVGGAYIWGWAHKQSAAKTTVMFSDLLEEDVVNSGAVETREVVYLTTVMSWQTTGIC